MLTTKWNNVVAAVNAIGWDDRHYTIMMVTNGSVLGRHHWGKSERRLILKSHIPRAFRDEDTLRYIAWLKGFVVI